MPAEFAAPWEQWLDAVLAGSRERLRERWRESFLSAPAWRFVLAPGLASETGWAGVLVPSVDSVGRYYPLTLLCPLAGAQFDPEPALKSMNNWFAMAEMLASEALSPKVDIGAFDDSIAALPLPPSPLPLPSQIDRAAPSAARSKPSSAWFAEASEVSAGLHFTAEGLPSIEQYCMMLTGKPAQVAAAS